MSHAHTECLRHGEEKDLARNVTAEMEALPSAHILRVPRPQGYLSPLTWGTAPGSGTVSPVAQHSGKCSSQRPQPQAWEALEGLLAASEVFTGDICPLGSALPHGGERRNQKAHRWGLRKTPAPTWLKQRHPAEAVLPHTSQGAAPGPGTVGQAAPRVPRAGSLSLTCVGAHLCCPPPR